MNRKGAEFYLPFLVVLSIIIFTATASDPENNSFDYRWLVNMNFVESNGRELIWKGNAAGNYEISVKAVDSPYNAESNSMARKVTVEDAAPVLSFPEEVKFAQYVEGESNGNVYRLNLEDYVESNNEVDFSLNVLDNTFEHTKENTAPFNLRLYRPYTATALHLERDGNVLVINPVANYNGNDHGVKRLVVEAKDKVSGKVGKDTVEVNVVRTPVSKDLSEVRGFANHYNNVTTGEGFKVSPKEFYIWTGNIEDYDQKGLIFEDYEGPLTTQAQINYLESLANAIKTADDFFSNMEVGYMDNRDKFLELYSNRNSDAPITFGYGSNNESSTSLFKDKNGNFQFVDLRVKPEKNFNTYLHEGTHALGFDHPGIYTNGEEQSTVFSSGSELTEIPPTDLAIIRSFYETRKY